MIGMGEIFDCGLDKRNIVKASHLKVTYFTSLVPYYKSSSSLGGSKKQDRHKMAPVGKTNPGLGILIPI